MKRGAILLVMLVLALWTGRTASAEPAWGGNCLSCHSELYTGTVSVFGEDLLANPNESATGATDRGSLPTFQTYRGATKRLEVEITGLDPDDTYAVELTRLRFPGVEGGEALRFTGDCDWPEWGESATYYTDPVIRYRWGAGPTTFAYDIDVEASTGNDYFDLLFAVAGRSSVDRSLFYGRAHFYVQVLDSPADLNGDDDVNEQDLALLRSAYGHCDSEPEYAAAADLDSSGCVTRADYETWMGHYRDFADDPLAAPPGPPPGDFDYGGDIDLVDFAAFTDCMFGPNTAPTPTAPTTAQQCLDAFDLDDDADVDLRDHVILWR